jgi:hypothetical protein
MARHNLQADAEDEEEGEEEDYSQDDPASPIRECAVPAAAAAKGIIVATVNGLAMVHLTAYWDIRRSILDFKRGSRFDSTA